MSLSRSFIVLLSLTLPGAASARGADTRPTIDVVICLDVSGSMDGLIGSAQARLWNVVNDLARAKPAPNLRVALYSYGSNEYEKETGWVRREVDLTDDLDAVSQRLNRLKTPARPGSDEYVARVCRDALVQQKWSEEKDALKVIFVCGNEPASQDPVLKLKDIAELAKKGGVIINPIFCGPANHPEAADWKELASLAGGRFANIDQDRGVSVTATPQDKELAALSVKLSETYLSYGKYGKARADNQKVQDANADKASPGVAATRAVAKGGGLYRNEGWDLIDRLKADPKFDVKKVPAEELCDELKKLKPEEREKVVKEMLAKRQALQKQIAEVSARREDYLKAEAKKNVGKAEKVLDEVLRAILREQAKGKGVTIPE